jgi:hypothetical protein
MQLRVLLGRIVYMYARNPGNLMARLLVVLWCSAIQVRPDIYILYLNIQAIYHADRVLTKRVRMTRLDHFTWWQCYLLQCASPYQMVIKT